MTETGNVKCQICGCIISKENSCTLGDMVVCDDCYVEETHPIQTCDPKAVHSAKVLGQTKSVDDLQRTLYKFVKDKRKITLQEVCAEFNLSAVRVQNQFAVLRHIELVKGKKEGDKTYIVPF